MKPKTTVANVYLVIAALTGMLALGSGCELQHADGTTAGTDGDDTTQAQGEETKETGYLEKAKQKAQNFLKQAKEIGEDTASDVGEWGYGAVDSAQNAAEDSGQWISDTYKSLRDSGLTTAENTRQWVQDDIRNMNSFEYKILPRSSETQENLEATLNELGNERWDCFEVDESTFYFKRQKKSYLRNVPVKDLLKFVPIGGGDDE